MIRSNILFSICSCQNFDHKCLCCLYCRESCFVSLHVLFILFIKWKKMHQKQCFNLIFNQSMYYVTFLAHKIILALQTLLFEISRYHVLTYFFATLTSVKKDSKCQSLCDHIHLSPASSAFLIDREATALFHCS